MKKRARKKIKNLDELQEKYFGKRGSRERELYEEQIRLDTIGEFLKQTREENHLTQSQLAKKLGMDTTYVSKIENNVKIQRLDTIIKVLKALHGHLFIRFPDKNGGREVELI